jgi:ADP-ribose pyrophosphatase
VALPDGSQAGREYIIHPGAVVIVPILDDGRLVLERQYRYPLQQVLLEFPAGKLDPGESVGRRDA